MALWTAGGDRARMYFGFAGQWTKDDAGLHPARWCRGRCVRRGVLAWWGYGRAPFSRSSTLPVSSPKILKHYIVPLSVIWLWKMTGSRVLK